MPCRPIDYFCAADQPQSGCERHAIVTESPKRFVRRREDFDCANCQKKVRGTGYTNHCPRCLWSRHVDVSPGDRLATCRGMMEPVGVLYERGEYLVTQRCVECGHSWRNRAASVDSRDALHGLMGRAVAFPAARTGRRKPTQP
ncbi:RNHCP domain-containing protein [Nonomuraea sp. PA05]|uniref:RNHCP domain-containing protein n=1 Tax=Nonomuraea sp. PA05 TaxID=2604466 RepID=UPI003982ED44